MVKRKLLNLPDDYEIKIINLDATIEPFSHRGTNDINIHIEAYGVHPKAKQ